MAQTVKSQTATDPAAETGSSPARTSFAGLAGVRRFIVRWRFAIVTIVAVGIVGAGQLAEYLAIDPTLNDLTSHIAKRGWTVIAATLYMLVISQVLHRTVQRSLEPLKRALECDDAQFQPYAVRMRRPEIWVEGLLLAVAAVIVALLFVVMKLELPVVNVDDPGFPHPSVYLPKDPSWVLVFAGYAVVGWAGLRLVYVTTRLARVLGEMSHQPLQIDVFDTSNLLPFGNIALTVALAPVGVIGIFLAGLGPPLSVLGWMVLALSAIASVLALLLPIHGIHTQMARAKYAVLKSLNDRISAVYHEYLGITATQLDPSELIRFTNRTNTLVPLRKTVQEMTTWPFRDTLTFGRAVVIASAPIIYAGLSRLLFP